VLAPVGGGTIALLLVARFGGSISTLVPMGISLALKLDQIAPGREELLGFVLGANALSSLVTTPLTGILSDRTRTRWGRRRPYTIGGIVVGLAAVPLVAFAPTVLALIIGWILCSLGFGTAVSSIGNFTADRLPQSQRGRISGMSSFATHVAPVVGVIVAGFFTDDMWLLFLVPALCGVVGMTAFAIFIDEPDSRGLQYDDRLSFVRIVRSYGFSPRSAPDFGWNWLGRFVLFFGLSLATSYTPFYFAQRLGTSVAEVVDVVAITSGFSIVSALIGGVGCGWLSDRLDRRRIFIALAVTVYAGGMTVLAFAAALPALVVGSFLMSLGIAIFTSVNQAMTLDILPDRGGEAGRYMAISMFSQRIPTALAPLLAPALLAIGAVGGDKNYTVTYLVAGSLGLIGGLLIAWRVRSVR
jgi:MFS family permease